jgi:hypothetical protein
MRKGWRIVGHNDDNKEDNHIDNDSMGMETSLGADESKQSSVNKQKCFSCWKKGHRSVTCPNKEKKGQSKKDDAAADASIKRTRSKCCHCGKPGHKENNCWKKHPHKAPTGSSTEASGTFLDEELPVCNIAQDKVPYITQDVDAACYCVSVIEDGQWEDLDSRMGLIESLMGQEGPLMADPCK